MPTQPSKPPRVVSQKFLAAAAEARANRKPDFHLYRGAPAARSWSKYQETDQAWALCGVSNPEHSSADAHQTTCPFCLQLLRRP